MNFTTFEKKILLLKVVYKLRRNLFGVAFFTKLWLRPTTNIFLKNYCFPKNGPVGVLIIITSRLRIFLILKIFYVAFHKMKKMKLPSWKNGDIPIMESNEEKLQSLLVENIINLLPLHILMTTLRREKTRYYFQSKNLFSIYL